MTATVDLVRMARDVVPPRGASTLRTIAEVEPSSRLSNGMIAGVVIEADGSTRKPRTRYGVAWLIDGLRQDRPIAMFDSQRDALAFHRLLAGEDVVSPRDPRGPSLPVRLCAGCDEPLPAGSRPNRTTHDGGCRIAAARRRAASKGAGEDTSPNRADVTVSGANFGVPTPRPGQAEPAAESARGEPDPGRIEAPVQGGASLSSVPVVAAPSSGARGSFATSPDATSPGFIPSTVLEPADDGRSAVVASLETATAP